MEIRIVEYGSDDYKKMVRLRERVLREPLGMKFKPEYLAQDKDDIHIAMFDNDEVVGTLLIKDLGQGIAKIRQVAVLPTLQGQGIGRQLMLFAEEHARKLGFKKIILHARFYTIGFYKKLGHEITSGPFEEIGMEHYRMEKQL